ncbi:MAG: hypothetical protein CMO80_06495 [Verrucomicrobiales bacterium]|nr:hypothetical protein [Verrucomicrobiales bacterium]
MKRLCLLVQFLLVVCTYGFTGNQPMVIDLWPGVPPGDENVKLDAEYDRFKDGDKLIAGQKIIKLANVSKPQIAIYHPEPEIDTGAAVIVCPGGGHHILAYDLEGTEVAEWLNKSGVTGIVLKYRVPFRNKERRFEAAVQDAQRAISIVRSRAGEWSIDPRRIGILGFSAGGETAGQAALLHAQRLYKPIDKTDQVSCRPDFAALIYPGGFTDWGEGRLRDYIKVPSDVPPFFFAHAFNDRVSVENSLLLATAIKRAKGSAAVHIYPSGGHGYGLRRTSEAVTTWPARCEEWMRSLGLLKTGALAQRFTKAWDLKKPLPALSAIAPKAKLDLAYQIQRLWVKATLDEGGIGGVKGAAVTPGAQSYFGIAEPIAAFLRGSGAFRSEPNPVINSKDWPGLKIETEIGFIVGRNIDREPRSVDDFKNYIRAIVPVVELPAGSWTPNGEVNAVDLTAVNVTSAAYIVGREIKPRKTDPRDSQITLTKDGEQLHAASGADCWKGPWETGFWLVGHAYRQGVELKPGQLIICGALGKVQPGVPGRYHANYGNLGRIEFTVR